MEIANRALNRFLHWRRIDEKVDLLKIQIGQEEHGHAVGEDPQIVVFVDFDVRWENQPDIVPIHHSL